MTECEHPNAVYDSETSSGDCVWYYCPDCKSYFKEELPQ